MLFKATFNSVYPRNSRVNFPIIGFNGYSENYTNVYLNMRFLVILSHILSMHTNRNVNSQKAPFFVEIMAL